MVEHNPIVKEALKWLGHPRKYHSAVECRANCYEHGMDPAGGFDCSAFVRYVLLHAGLPERFRMAQQLAQIRHCDEFFRAFGMTVHEGLRQPGDLVFFTRQGNYPQHMGILIDGQNYIHSSQEEGRIIIAELDFLRLEVVHPRQLYLTNPIGFKRLSEPDGRWTVPVSW